MANNCKGINEETSAVPSGTAGRLTIALRFVFAVATFTLVVFLFFYVLERLQREDLGSQADHTEISLEEPPTAGEAESPPFFPGGRPLRFALAPVISPEKSIEHYRKLGEYLARKLERNLVFIQRQSYAEINQLIRSRRCDVALICTYPFVQGQKEFGMEAIAVPIIRGEATYRSFIIVAASSTAHSLLDLKGKRFASASLLSNSGWLFPAVWLLKRGSDPDSFFSEHLITGSHDRAVQSVVSGYTDGAAVDSIVFNQLVEETPSVAENTRIILRSPPFGMPPIVVHPKTDARFKKRLSDALLTMHENPRGRGILAAMRIDCFKTPDPNSFDSVREAADYWEARR